MNFFFPGAGLIYLGRTLAGALLAGAFTLCFLAVLGIFLSGYAKYLSISLSGDLLQGDRLEQIGASFHSGWLLACMIMGVLIYGASMLALGVVRRRETSRATVSR